MKHANELTRTGVAIQLTTIVSVCVLDAYNIHVPAILQLVWLGLALALVSAAVVIHLKN